MDASCYNLRIQLCPMCPAQAPGSMYNRSDDIDQIATAAVLQQQEAEMRATLAQQKVIIDIIACKYHVCFIKLAYGYSMHYSGML